MTVADDIRDSLETEQVNATYITLPRESVVELIDNYNPPDAGQTPLVEDVPPAEAPEDEEASAPEQTSTLAPEESEVKAAPAEEAQEEPEPSQI